MSKQPIWLEPRAWRSLKSWPSIAAQKAEMKAWNRLTTFVSVASSGAEIEKGLLAKQYDFQTSGQIEEVQKLLRDPNVHDHRENPHRPLLKRPVDVLLMSIGGNDCGFAGALTDMTKDNLIIGRIWNGASQREVRKEVDQELARLPEKYDRLAREIVDRLNPKKVIIPEYPTALFDGDDGKPHAGCGLFDITEGAGKFGHQLGISSSDAGFIEDAGNRLNDVLQNAATRNGWTVVGGIADAFKGHGYCSSDRYWRQAEESCNTQDDLEGTLHPNGKGTAVIAKKVQGQIHIALNDLTRNDPTAGITRRRRAAVATE